MPASLVETLRTEHDEAVSSLVDQLAESAGGPLAAALAQLLAEVSALWVQMFGDLERPADPERIAVYQRRLNALLVGLPAGIDVDELLDDLGAAMRLGVDQAAAEAKAKKVRTSVPADTVTEVRSLPARIGAALGGARVLLRVNPLARFGDVLAVVGAARQALTAIERTARWAGTKSVAEGAVAVCDAEGIPKLWVPERDGCLHCLAYAGRLVAAGSDFPAGLTFSDKPLKGEAVKAPPLHPNCRCRISPWRGASQRVTQRSPGGKAPVGTDYPAVLRREAERAVLRGWAIGESNPALLRAADRLLKAGPALPKTVVARAKRSVAAGVLT